MARSAVLTQIWFAKTVVLLPSAPALLVMRTAGTGPGLTRAPGLPFTAVPPFLLDRDHQLDLLGSSWEIVPIETCPEYVTEMPFAAHKSAFDPEELQVLQEAFELAWSDISLVPIISNDPDDARELLAQRIVDAAKIYGERDPEELKRHALRAFQT